jgi:hypothetical protein
MLQSPDMRSRELRKRQRRLNLREGGRAFTPPTPLPPVARATDTRPQTPLELANTAKREFEAKSKQRDDANVKLAETQPGTKERTDAESNSNRIETEYRNAVIKYFRAWGEVFKTNPKIAQEEYEKATELAEEVAFDVVHPIPSVNLGREPTAKEVSDYKRYTHIQPSEEAPPLDTSDGASKAVKPVEVARKPAGKIVSSAEVAKQAATAYQVAQQQLNAAHARFDAAKKKLDAIDKSVPATARTKKEALKSADELKGATTDAYVDAAEQAQIAARSTRDAGKIARAEKAFADAIAQQLIARQDAWNVQQLYKE